ELRWDIFQKDYLTEASKRKLKSMWLEKEINYDRSKDDAKRIGISPYFDYAKPVSLLSKIVMATTRPGDLVLDFFAGSATTADAISRNISNEAADQYYILVKLPEPIDASSAAAKDVYRKMDVVSRAWIAHAVEFSSRE